VINDTRSRLFRSALLLAVFAAAISEPVSAQPFHEVQARLAAKASQVFSIQSSFTQEKRLSIFNQTINAAGSFAFERPGSLRWEYLEPVRSGFVLHGGAGRRWNELAGEEREFSVSKDPVMQIVSGQILLWTTLDFEALARAFRMDVESPSPAVLRFTPLQAAASPIAWMRITFTPDEASIASIEIMESEGDSTLIRFHGTRLNEPVADGVFTRP